MTDSTQPEALRLADELDAVPETGADPQTIQDAAAELRRQHAESEMRRTALLDEMQKAARQHAENETLRAKIKAYEDLDEAASDVQLLRMGYAAARLEIESLQARIKTMAEEHADELMVAHLDGMRAAQPAGAQQPGAAYAALPDADRDYMRKVVAVAVTMLFDGYKEDVMRVFSTGELSEFVTITAAMRVEKVEDIYRRAWDLLSLPASASHGQAPAQAIPAAAAGCTRSHPHENMDSACRAKAAIAEMQNMAARGAEATTHDLERFVAMLAAAPTTQPAPQQDAQEPVDSMGMPLSCGKPLCAPGNHHPLCKLAPPPPAPQPDSAPAEAVQRIVHLRADRERRVYVAGPMTGLPEYNFPLFNATAARLRSEGWHVENPAEHGHVDGAGWSDYLRWDISRIATCGAIYLLPGWSKSKGATLEVHIAGVLGLQVLLADGAEAPQADSVTAPVGCNNIPGMAEKALAKLKSHIDHVAHKDAAPEIVQGRVTWLAKQSSPERPKSGG